MKSSDFFEHDKARFQKWLNSEEYQEKLTQRLKVNDACLRSRESQVLTFQICKEDPIFFIENFGWTFDPRPQHEPHHLPFILFDYQKDVIRWLIKKIDGGEDGLLEKSRDMGITWMVVYVLYWKWRFADSFSGMVGSRKEKLVDDRTRDSIFGMLDYALENTPHWLMPNRFKWKEYRQKLKLVNPENFNLITGDTMSPEFSRGSRKTTVILDEGAFWEYFREAWESAGDTTPCRLVVSTPFGRNAFALLRESGIDVLTVHWKDHPFKDDKWYEFQKERRTDEEIAQELDISYHRSQSGRVYPEWDEVEYGYYPYDETLPLYCSWDFGFTDDTAMVWWQSPNNDKTRVIDAYANHGKIIDFYIPFVTGQAPSDDYKYSKKDLEVIESHKHWRKGIHYGDPAGKFQTQVTDQTILTKLKQYGIIVNFREDAKDFQKRKNETKLLLRELVVNDNPRTRELGLAMENAQYPEIRGGGGTDVRSVKPIHDWSSHYRSSVEYFAVNFASGRSRKTQVYDKFPKKDRPKLSLTGY
ncbi:MAG TPA: hypothetical protein ENI23_16185 [bacterium]|nr:hypothetical protein [bacterium]